MRVVIAGGGNVGTFIADDLAKAGHEVTIVEVDAERVRAAKKLGEPAGRHLGRGRRLRAERAGPGRPRATPTSSPRSPATTRTTSSSRCSPSRSSPCPASSPG